MICDFAYNNEFVYDLKKLLHKLPHSGFNAFSLSNKEIKGIMNNQFPMIEELNFNHKKIKYIFGNCIRFMTLNEEEMIEILHKQLFEYMGDMISAHSKNCHLGININFDGSNSQLIFYGSDYAVDFDFSKLEELAFSTIKNDFKYIELDKEKLEKIIVTNEGNA